MVEGEIGKLSEFVFALLWAFVAFSTGKLRLEVAFPIGWRIIFHIATSRYLQL